MISPTSPVRVRWVPAGAAVAAGLHQPHVAGQLLFAAVVGAGPASPGQAPSSVRACPRGRRRWPRPRPVPAVPASAGCLYPSAHTGCRCGTPRSRPRTAGAARRFRICSPVCCCMASSRAGQAAAAVHGLARGQRCVRRVGDGLAVGMHGRHPRAAKPPGVRGWPPPSGKKAVRSSTTAKPPAHGGCSLRPAR